LSLIAGLAGLLVIAVAIALGGARTQPSTALPAIAATVPPGLPSDGLALGRADAPVTVDLYEDFQCPACRSWGTNVFPPLAANELADGRARIVFHPMAFIGGESVGAAASAYAAAAQGRFWDMWATLYANQGHENDGAFSRARLVEMAGLLGLDLARFESDIESTAAADALAASEAGAVALGVTSTPTIVIGSDRLVGVGSYEELSAMIAAAAESAGASDGP
jgi:protein-disulfide isomerase